MPQLHEYPISADWTGGRDGHGTVKPGHSGRRDPGGGPARVPRPGRRDEPGGALTGSIASCYSITFGIVATNRRLLLKGSTWTQSAP